jgi:hypothetical protein
MENHPIPQDITGFQFKLIGSMTVKQFAYLAGGVIIAWFLFSSHITFIIRFPLALLSAGLGASFAFVPFEGRPLDTMVMNFIKAFFSPTQYVYQKTGGSLEASVYRIAPVPSQTAAKARPSDEKEKIFTESVSSLYQPRIMVPNDQQTVPIQAPVVGPAPIVDEPETVALEPQKTEPHDTAEKVNVEAVKAVQIKQDGTNVKPQEEVKEFSKEPPAPVAHITQPVVKQIPTSITTTAGIPMTPEVPNLVTGIIKDPRGNPIQYILVEIKDGEGNPVRAFKTNGLGHFASATPLSDGAYTISLEDTRMENKFQTLSFEAKGDIIFPFEIISVDKREELRRELFN